MGNILSRSKASLDCKAVHIHYLTMYSIHHEEHYVQLRDSCVLVEFEEGHTTWYASAFLLINVVLGAGLLEFPYAFSQSGDVLIALIIQVVRDYLVGTSSYKFQFL